jgi:hypothetical protein
MVYSEFLEALGRLAKFVALCASLTLRGVTHARSCRSRIKDSSLSSSLQDLLTVLCGRV